MDFLQQLSSENSSDFLYQSYNNDLSLPADELLSKEIYIDIFDICCIVGSL